METEIVIQLTKYKGYSILYLLKSKLTSEVIALLTLLLSYCIVLRLSNGTVHFNSGNALNRFYKIIEKQKSLSVIARERWSS